MTHSETGGAALVLRPSLLWTGIWCALFALLGGTFLAAFYWVTERPSLAEGALAWGAAYLLALLLAAALSGLLFLFNPVEIRLDGECLEARFVLGIRKEIPWAEVERVALQDIGVDWVALEQLSLKAGKRRTGILEVGHDPDQWRLLARTVRDRVAAAGARRVTGWEAFVRRVDELEASAAPAPASSS